MLLVAGIASKGPVGQEVDAGGRAPLVYGDIVVEEFVVTSSTTQITLTYPADTTTVTLSERAPLLIAREYDVATNSGTLTPVDPHVYQFDLSPLADPMQLPPNSSYRVYVDGILDSSASVDVDTGYVVTSVAPTSDVKVYLYVLAGEVIPTSLRIDSWEYGNQTFNITPLQYTTVLRVAYKPDYMRRVETVTMNGTDITTSVTYPIRDDNSLRVYDPSGNLVTAHATDRNTVTFSSAPAAGNYTITYVDTLKDAYISSFYNFDTAGIRYMRLGATAASQKLSYVSPTDFTEVAYGSGIEWAVTRAPLNSISEVKVDGVATTAYSADLETGKITLTSAPTGTHNIITAALTASDITVNQNSANKDCLISGVAAAWEYSSPPASIRVDYGSSYWLTSRLRFYYEGDATSCEVFISSDDISYSSIGSFTPTSGVINEWIASPGSIHRYVKVVFSGGTSGKVTNFDIFVNSGMPVFNNHVADASMVTASENQSLVPNLFDAVPSDYGDSWACGGPAQLDYDFGEYWLVTEVGLVTGGVCDVYSSCDGVSWQFEGSTSVMSSTYQAVVFASPRYIRYVRIVMSGPTTIKEAYIVGDIPFDMDSSNTVLSENPSGLSDLLADVEAWAFVDGAEIIIDLGGLLHPYSIGCSFTDDWCGVSYTGSAYMVYYSPDNVGWYFVDSGTISGSSFSATLASNFSTRYIKLVLDGDGSASQLTVQLSNPLVEVTYNYGVNADDIYVFAKEPGVLGNDIVVEVARGALRVHSHGQGPKPIWEYKFADNDSLRDVAALMLYDEACPVYIQYSSDAKVNYLTPGSYQLQYGVDFPSSVETDRSLLPVLWEPATHSEAPVLLVLGADYTEARAIFDACVNVKPLIITYRAGVYDDFYNAEHDDIKPLYSKDPSALYTIAVVYGDVLANGEQVPAAYAVAKAIEEIDLVGNPMARFELGDVIEIPTLTTTELTTLVENGHMVVSGSGAFRFLIPGGLPIVGLGSDTIPLQHRVLIARLEQALQDVIHPYIGSVTKLAIGDLQRDIETVLEKFDPLLGPLTYNIEQKDDTLHVIVYLGKYVGTSAIASVNVKVKLA